MLHKNYSIFLFSLLIALVSKTYGEENIVDIISDSNESISSKNLNTEKILKISSNRKIIIISNNSSFSPGDFISIVVDGELISRGLVAKIIEEKVGVKITKIYSNKLFSAITPNINVKVIRGDDSYYKKKAKSNKKNISSLLQTEDDFFDSNVVLKEDTSINENKNRVIKTDNIISGVINRVEGLDIEGRTTRYSQVGGGWAYQIEDNIWAEGLYSQNIINDYPGLGLDTKLTNITFKIKYTINAPLHSFIQPYVGYQNLNATSPGAGASVEGTNIDPTREVERVELLKTNSLVFGLTFLKRLVPGWFARADMGTDTISMGFALEF